MDLGHHASTAGSMGSLLVKELDPSSHTVKYKKEKEKKTQKQWTLLGQSGRAEEEWGGRVKQIKGIKMYKFPVIKKSESWGYNVGIC